MPGHFPTVVMDTVRFRSNLPSTKDGQPHPEVKLPMHALSVYELVSPQTQSLFYRPQVTITPFVAFASEMQVPLLLRYQYWK